MMPKLRSHKACKVCRARKVRCDVGRTGIPCSNCDKSSANCSVQAVRKSRQKSGINKPNLPHENLFTFEVSPQGINRASTNGSEPLFNGCGVTSSGQAIGESIDMIPRQSQPVMSQADFPTSFLTGLPKFVSPFSSELERDVLHLLHKRGVLTVPDQALLEEAIGLYTCYVHPLLPLLDMRQILDAIHLRNGSAISLLLIHAIVFAASAFMESSQLTALGFENRPSARRVLFERVKLLYEMDVEHNALTMIQALLLMTYWYGQQNDTKGRLYWLRTAISLAIDIGLDHDSELSLPKSQRLLRQKVWYCCIMREKSLALTERRVGSLQVSVEKSKILAIEHFEDLAFTEALNLYYMPASERVMDIITRLCVQKIKLSLIIGRILDSQYQLSGIRRVNSSEIFMVLIPSQTTNTTSQAVLCEEEIRQWRLQTVAIQGSRFGLDHRNNGRVLGVHSATLELLYLTAVSMIYRPLMLQEPEKDSAAATLQSFSQRELRGAARRVSEICRHLQDGNLVRFLPPLAVGAFIASSIQHLKDALSTDSELRSSGQLYLSQTLDAFSALKDMYNSATCALSFIQRVKSGALPYRTFEWEASTEIIQHHDNNADSSENIALGEVADTDFNLADTIASNPPFERKTLSELALAKDLPDEMNQNSNISKAMTNEHDFRIDDISDLFFSAALDMNQIEWIDSAFDKI